MRKHRSCEEACSLGALSIVCTQQDDCEKARMIDDIFRPNLLMELIRKQDLNRGRG